MEGYLYVDGRLIAASRERLRLEKGVLHWESGDPIRGKISIPVPQGLQMAVAQAASELPSEDD